MRLHVCVLLYARFAVVCTQTGGIRFNYTGGGGWCSLARLVFGKTCFDSAPILHTVISSQYVNRTDDALPDKPNSSLGNKANNSIKFTGPTGPVRTVARSLACSSDTGSRQMSPFHTHARRAARHSLHRPTCAIRPLTASRTCETTGRISG